MSEDDIKLMDRLVQMANEKFGGHVTIMKFTTNWRVCFGTLTDAYDLRADIQKMAVGNTFAEAAAEALANPHNMYGGLRHA